MKHIKVMRDGRPATAEELQCAVEGKPLPPSDGSADSCLFCDNPRQLKHGCQKQRWLVCEKHTTCKCPECGGLAHWMEGMKKGNYYLCFDSLACWWRAANPPNDQTERENQKLRAALESIINQQPCCEGGGCFYPMHDGEGNYIGEQNVDPLGVIQGMVQTAQDALSPNEKGERRARQRRSESEIIV